VAEEAGTAVERARGIAAPGGPDTMGGRSATGSRGASIERWLAHDLSRPVAFTLLAIVCVASRLPFIDNGYGTKPDAWRIALTGYWLWDRHEFYPSRLPGYPVPELANAALLKGGWLATNSLTLAVALVGIWFFAKIVRRLELPNPALLVAGFAFTPLLWINSMNTMDYEWALTFILASYYFILIDNEVAGGIAMGLAVGSRLPSAGLLVPFVVLMWRSGKRDEIRTYIVGTMAVALLAYSPVIWRYGPKFLNFYDASVGYREVVRLLAKDALGLAGSLALVLGVIVSLPRLARLPGDFVRDKQVMAWVLAVAVVAATFFRLPHEAAYLIAAYPFAYFIIGRYFSLRTLAAVIAVVVLAGFVDFTTTNHEVSAGSIRHLRIGQGMLLSNRDTQRAQHRFTQAVRNLPVQDNSVVIVGFVYPEFAVTNRNRLQLGLMARDKDAISQLSDKGMAFDPQHRVTYVWLLDWDDFQKYRLQAAHVYYTLDADRSTQALYGYRPGLFGGTLIDLGKAPSGESETDRTQR
jgi:uncharacterized membrane protein